MDIWIGVLAGLVSGAFTGGINMYVTVKVLQVKLSACNATMANIAESVNMAHKRIDAFLLSGREVPK
jgi:hypothetical protein